MELQLEYDIEKSSSNKEKHGIDFHDAQKIWLDPLAVQLPVRQVMDEERFVVIGKIDDKLWSAIMTYRGKNIRLISVRRARAGEEKYYESI